MTDNREMGVEFGTIEGELEAESYPLTNQNLIEQYGAHEVSHAGGEESIRSLLGEISDTYESSDEVRQAILNMVSQGPEGRQQYTDRGTSLEDEDYDQESL